MRFFEVQIQGLGRQSLAPPGVGSEQVAQMRILDLLVVGGEVLPRASLGERLNRRFHAAFFLVFF